jgi:cysteinyl-tRNA synthetase
LLFQVGERYSYYLFSYQTFDKMNLNLYDNWTRSLRPFDPLKPGHVGMYSCGPTVYDYQHIGNLRTYLFVDGLKRVLLLNGYDVLHVMNITDVGHLTSDADEGEDKMEKGSRRTGKSAREIADLYTDVFRNDLKQLNILDPGIWCKATDHIPEQIGFIADIERNGFAYRTADGIYFDTSKIDDYGYLARLNKEGLEAGHRIEVGEKRNATDFALWKFSRPGENRQMEWQSPWGIGFPGWHIECSAMAQKYLGDFFDIHCGGEDHLPVHHTNEIAQTQARIGTRLANFWLHGFFLLETGDKMSKSKGEFLRLAVLIDKGYDPLSYRYLCLTGHYRSQLNFSFEALDGAQTALNRLRAGIYGTKGQSGEADDSYLARFMADLNDDLNFPRAVALAWEVLKSDLSAGVKRATLLKFDQGFGLGLEHWKPEEEVIPEHIIKRAEERWQAKQARNWAVADRLRKEIQEQGFMIEDVAESYRLKRL